MVNYLCVGTQTHTRSEGSGGWSLCLQSTGQDPPLSSGPTGSSIPGTPRPFAGSTGLVAISGMKTSSSKGPRDHNLHRLALIQGSL